MLPCDDLHFDLLHRLTQATLELRPLIAAIRVKLAQEGVPTEQRRHQQHAAVAILNAGRMNGGVQKQTRRVSKDMPLLASDLLAAIMTRRSMQAPLFQRS